MLIEVRMRPDTTEWKTNDVSKLKKAFDGSALANLTAGTHCAPTVVPNLLVAPSVDRQSLTKGQQSRATVPHNHLECSVGITLLTEGHMFRG